MATSSATTTAVPNALTALGFTKLSAGVSLYKPASSAISQSQQNDPTLIIICSWAFAQPKHIAKYVQPYQQQYPDASILLIQNTISNAIWRPDNWQMSFFQPAASAIQSHLSMITQHRILLHAFSNGGSYAAVQLSQACRETCGGMRMPVDALILDSCPGQPRFQPTIDALVQGIPTKNPVVRGVATVLSYAATGGTALMDVLNISEPAAWKLYRKLNDPNDVFLLRSDGSMIPRTYIYSKSDTMILEEDVLGHARVAKEKLLARGVSESDSVDHISTEEFLNTEHVNHIRYEPERYWAIIRKNWNEAM